MYQLNLRREAQLQTALCGGLDARGYKTMCDHGWFTSCLSFAVLQLFLAAAATSQPTVISPLDVARTHQYSSITDNFSHSDLYDFEHPLELLVHIHHLHRPKDGYAVIVYTMAQDTQDSAAVRRSGSEKYIATLNASSVLTEKDFGKMKIPQGATAILYGWPATDRNLMNSTLLVDELHLLDSDQWYAFHQPSEKLRKHKKAKGQRFEGR
ncbi:hypothetical protein [Kineobactrum salinum]|uniref:Uncharacterized protein n=1 Tax=Kineobactrum salinum TaxID=2708301 RepID=A0A6C0U1A7_9GAMM|nr:hypothetical protein [Kineobactrum salinum]QIB64767.1 hypothetical protein G3T16_04565 [Kineobactrum salinum]